MRTTSQPEGFGRPESMIECGWRLWRNAPVGKSPLSSVLECTDHCPALIDLVGGTSALGRFLAATRVDVVDEEGYLWVDDDDGTISICSSYLREGPEQEIIIDLVHELVHVHQQSQGRPLYDKRYAYVDRPTEIEAYAVCIKEARRLGLSEAQIVNYLRVPWVSAAEHLRLCAHLSLRVLPAHSPSP